MFHFQKLKNILHLFEAIAANLYFRFPSRQLTVIGVTGTDGKTTTAHLIHHILTASGRKCALITSMHAVVAGVVFETGLHTTTPRSWTLQQFLRQAVAAGEKYFVIETTSHAIDQYRVWGVSYAISVLTNVTDEHRYHHRTFENYLDCKLKLLGASDQILINRDQPNFSVVHKGLMRKGLVYSSFSLSGPESDFVWPRGLKTNLKGDFNRQNVLGAYACCCLLGISESQIAVVLKSFKAPKGRWEVIYDKKFTVIVDFAHTPHAVNSILKSVAHDRGKNQGRIIHIFGAASERDDLKRPEMGRASANGADVIILTEEDYRKEDFESICNQIASGFKPFEVKRILPNKLNSSSTSVYTTIKNRADAISRAVSIATNKDIIIATGKSHEKSLNRDGREYPWDEYKAFEEALKKYDYLR